MQKKKQSRCNHIYGQRRKLMEYKSQLLTTKNCTDYLNPMKTFATKPLNKQINSKQNVSPEDIKRRQERSICFNYTKVGNTVEFCIEERNAKRIKINEEKFKSKKAKRKSEDLKSYGINPHKKPSTSSSHRQNEEKLGINLHLFTIEVSTEDFMSD